MPESIIVKPGASRLTAQDRIKQRKVDYSICFGSEVGKRVMEDLQLQHWFLASTFTPGDPSETAFREGQRSVVLRALAIINQAGDAVMPAGEQEEDIDA